MEIAPWEVWVRSTWLHAFVQAHEPWVWPLCETLHYLGLSLLLGTVGLFDLRVLGLAKGIPPGTLHRLVPWVWPAIRSMCSPASCSSPDIRTSTFITMHSASRPRSWLSPASTSWPSTAQTSTPT